MESKRLIEILEDAGCPVRRYSGRGMFGVQCVAFTLDDCNSLLGVVADIVANTDDNDERRKINKIFRTALTDSMGLSTIVYFPRMKWEGDE